MPDTSYTQVTDLSATGIADFITPALEDYQPPNYPALTKIQAISQVLSRRYIVLLGGDPTVNTLALARQLAWHTSQRLAHVRSDGQKIPLPVREWIGSGSRNIEQVLHQFDERTVFILPNLHPRHINHDLLQLLQLVRERFYVIATVDEEASWQQLMKPEAFNYFWHALDARLLYTVDDLHAFLYDRLVRDEVHLSSLNVRSLVGNKATLAGIPLKQLARELRQPENINEFVLQLCEIAERGTLNDETIINCLRAAQDDGSRLRLWYSRLNNPRDQLLVLAINLFDGILDDQFFAITDELIRKSWHWRDPSLRGLDYCDLEPLHNFFDYTLRQSGETAIKTRLTNQRRLLIDITWNSHRRHMLNALPVLYQSVVQSVKESGDLRFWQIYGSRSRRNQLRKTITESISDIGLKSTTAIELWLLQFAIHPDIGVQAVAARAIARWREFDQHEATLGLLKRWMNKREPQAILDDSSLDPQEKYQKPDISLRQTIVLTIGYASQADPPNHIEQSLFDMLKVLIEEGEINVLSYITSFTLPMMLTLHVWQTRDLVRHLATEEELHTQIANAYAQVYTSQHMRIHQVLDRWYKWCILPARRNAIGKELTERNLVLACICAIYGRLPYDKAPTGKQITAVFERLRDILQLETAPAIRKAALTTIIQQMRSAFDELQDILPVVTSDEMSAIIGALIEIYLDQREAQSGGQSYMRVSSKRYYPVWITKLRPFTAIEMEMHQWVSNTSNVIAQQIALRALITFHQELAEDEKRHIDRMQRPRDRRKRPTDDFNQRQITSPKIGLYPREWYSYYIIPWVVTLTAPQYLLVIRAVLPEVLFQNRVNQPTLRELLEEWQFRRNKDIVELSRRLSSALWWAQNGWVAAFIAIAIISIIIINIVLIVQGLRV